MSTTPTADKLLETVNELEPLIREHASQSEAKRRLAPEVAAAMRDAGLYAMYRPRDWGGFELDPMTVMTVVEAVARIDSATGWNLGNAASFDSFGAPLYPIEGAREISGNPHAIHAVAAFPPGKAIPVDGGYRVTAETPFLSGCHEASWCTLGVHVIGPDGPRSENGVPVLHIASLPREEVEILDSWNTLGMRGTGSHSVVVDDKFVPDRRLTPLVPIDDYDEVYSGPLYRLSLWSAVPVIGAVAIGVATTALHEVVHISLKKTPAYMTSALRDRGFVHTQLAKARACIGAARAYLHAALTHAWNTASDGGKLNQDQKIEIQLAAAHANRTSADAIDLVYDVAGATGIRYEYSLQKHFRDAHTLSQHAFGNTARFESSGRLMMGLESDWGFFAF